MKKLLAPIKTKGESKKEIAGAIKDTPKKKDALSKDGEIQVVFFGKNPKATKKL